MIGNLKPGDSLSISRDGKVFLTQYSSVGGFVSLTRTMGEDPEADVIEMQDTLDAMWRDAVLRNHKAVNAAYAALGTDSDIDALLAYLEGKVPDVVPEKEAPKSVKKPFKRKLH